MWRFRWFALLVAWPLCLIGWLYVYYMPSIYQARAQVYIDTQSVLKPLLDGLAVRAEVTDRVGMMTRALVSRPTLSEIAGAIETSFETWPPAKQHAFLTGLERQIYLGPGEREHIYEIRYQDENRARALQVVELLLRNLVQDTVKLTRTDTTAAQEFLDSQIADYEARLTTAEQRLADFKKEHVGLMPSQGQDYYSNLQEAMSELGKARAALELALRRRDELQRQLVGDEPVFGMVEAPALKEASEIDRAIEGRQQELERLRLQFTEQHPDVVALKEVIAQLQARKRANDQGRAATSAANSRPQAVSLAYQATTIALSQAEVEVSTLRTKAGQLQVTVDELRKSVDTIPEVEAKLASLNRDYDITRRQYEALVARLESARLSDDAEQSNEEIKFRVIEPPVVPPTPVSINRPLLLTVVLAAGFLAGLGLTFLLHQVRPVFLNSDMLNRAIGLPVLGVVSLQLQALARFRRRMELTSLGVALLLLLCSYGGLVKFSDEGARALRAFVSDLVVQL
jgi:polysaccharide chain length determinant protein (PEP-CTERM system associated)